MAGTTVEDDQEVAGALQRAMEHYGYTIDIATINQVMGYPKPVAIRKLLDQYGTAAAGLLDKIHQYFESDMVAYYEQSAHVKEKSNAAMVFDALRQHGIQVAIDTGFSRPIADAIFQRLGWQQGGHFDVSITSDEVAQGRPFPDMIYKAMEYCGIEEAAEVAKVGDTASDMQQGQAAGCRYIIGVTTGAYSAESLSREPHTHLIADLKELLPLLAIESFASTNF